MVAGKERVLHLREQVEALEAQLADARSSLATFKVGAEDAKVWLGHSFRIHTAQMHAVSSVVGSGPATVPPWMSRQPVCSAVVSCIVLRISGGV